MRTHQELSTLNYLGTSMSWHLQGTENGGLLSLCEVWLCPGDEPPLHIHAREDEAWYIIEGEVLFQIGLERACKGAGESILLPRGVQHGFAVQSQSARILHFYTPAGIEHAFIELSTPMDQHSSKTENAQIQSSFEKCGVAFVGPPLPVILASERAGV